MSVGIITRSGERNEQMNATLREYGVDPSKATSSQREMADCIAQKTNEAYRDAQKVRR